MRHTEDRKSRSELRYASYMRSCRRGSVGTHESGGGFVPLKQVMICSADYYSDQFELRIASELVSVSLLVTVCRQCRAATLYMPYVFFHQLQGGRYSSFVSL